MGRRCRGDGLAEIADVPARACGRGGEREGDAGVDAAHGIPRFFFDFRRAKTSLDKGETPFTPPVSLILGLREALAMINEEGLPAVLARHARLSAALRAGFSALGFPMFPKGRRSRRPSRSASYRRASTARRSCATCTRNYRTVIAGQRTKLRNRVIRIGTMGFFGPDDILADLHYLECTLRDLGHAPAPGAGVQAAAASAGRVAHCLPRSFVYGSWASNRG